MNRYGKGLDDDYEPTMDDLLKEVVPEMVEDGELGLDDILPIPGFLTFYG